MKIAIGTAQFGFSYGIANKLGQVSRKDAKGILELALDSYVDTLDTAIAYGESESFLGELDVKKFKVVTKLPPIPLGINEAKNWIRSQVMNSMARLNVKNLYGLLLHRPAQLLSSLGPEIYSEMMRLKEEGIITKIGISIYTPDELSILVPLFKFDLVQTPFNLIDKRIYESGWLTRLSNEGIEIHSRSVFMQGLLLMPKISIPEQFSQWNHIWDHWSSWLDSHPGGALKNCLDYVLSFSEIEKVVVGVDSLIQLEQIFEAISKPNLLDFPEIGSTDINLINPAEWSKL